MVFASSSDSYFCLQVIKSLFASSNGVRVGAVLLYRLTLMSSSLVRVAAACRSGRLGVLRLLLVNPSFVSLLFVYSFLSIIPFSNPSAPSTRIVFFCRPLCISPWSLCILRKQTKMLSPPSNPTRRKTMDNSASAWPSKFSLARPS